MRCRYRVVEETRWGDTTVLFTDDLDEARRTMATAAGRLIFDQGAQEWLFPLDFAAVGAR